MRDTRVGIVGVGNVGATLAFSLAINRIANEILLKDIRVDLAQALSLDISQAAKANGSTTKVYSAPNPDDFRDCDIIVITAGIARKPGMSRDDLLITNGKIMKTIMEECAPFNKDAIFIIVTNPLDAMVHVALKCSNLPRNRVLGMAGILDSARMAHFISQKLDSKDAAIEAFVMGGHGDDMVPLLRHSKVNNQPLAKVLSQAQIQEIVQNTKQGGAQIVSLLKEGSAYYAPGFSTALMVDSILHDKKSLYPCAIALDGEYGYKDIVAGVPMRLGSKGCEEIVVLDLDQEERAQFAHSVNGVRELVSILDKKLFS